MVFVTTDPARDTEPVLRALPRPLRPRRSSGSPATSPTIVDGRAADSASRVDAGRAAARRRLRRHPRHHGARASTPTTRSPVVWTQGTSAAQFAADIHRCSSTTEPEDRCSTVPLSIPSPAEGVWYLGPVPIRGYALCIIAGIIAAIWIGERRWVARGGRPGEVSDLAVWAVPFGAGRRPALPRAHRPRRSTSARASTRSRRSTSGAAASASGARSRSARSASCIGARRKGIRLLPVLDAHGARACWSRRRSAGGATGSTRSCSAGRPTCPGAWRSTPSTGRPATQQYATFQPTFLYEFLWNLGAFGFVIWADRRFRLGHGRVVGALRDGLHRRAGLDRDAAHRRRRAQERRSGCGSTCGPRSCCSSPRAIYFVGQRAAAPRPRGAGRTDDGREPGHDDPGDAERAETA